MTSKMRLIATGIDGCMESMQIVESTLNALTLSSFSNVIRAAFDFFRRF